MIHFANHEQSTKKEGKDEIASLPFNSKTHATLNKKIFVTLYAKDLFFFNYSCRLESDKNL